MSFITPLVPFAERWIITMEEKKELFDEVATEEEINEADGQPIYHANEGEGEDESKEE